MPGDGGRDIEGILAGAEKGEIELVYLLGADEIDMAGFGKAFVIYQGHHGDPGAHRADVVLPGAAYTEKDATYVNTEGRVQQTHRRCSRPATPRRIGRILRALSEFSAHSLPMTGWRSCGPSVESIRYSMPSIRPSGRVGSPFGARALPSNVPLTSPIANFYMTDPISRASHTMAECTATFVGCAHRGSGTHG